MEFPRGARFTPAKMASAIAYVSLTPSGDLFICAKHLFVEANVRRAGGSPVRLATSPSMAQHNPIVRCYLVYVHSMAP